MLIGLRGLGERCVKECVIAELTLCTFLTPQDRQKYGRSVGVDHCESVKILDAG